MYMAVEVSGILSQRSFFCARIRVTSQTQLAEFAHVRKTKLKLLAPKEQFEGIFTDKCLFNYLHARYTT